MSEITINLSKWLNHTSILDVIRKLSAIYSNEVNCSKIIWNYTNVKSITPSALSTLASLIIDLDMRFNIESTEIQPEDSPVNQYMLRMGFYDLFEVDKSYNKNKRPSKNRFTEIYHFNSYSNINDVIYQANDIISTLIHNQNNRNVGNALGYCIVELMDNAYCHSNCNCCISHSQRYNQQGFTEFSVVDNGVGIRETMGCKTITEALNKCIIKGEKGINSTGKGFGLYSSTEILRKDENTSSFIEIHSEDAIMKVSSGQSPVLIKAPYWQGTRVIFHLCDYLKTNVNELIHLDNDIYENGDLNNFTCEDFSIT